MKTNWCKLPYELIEDEKISPLSAMVYAIMLDRAKGGVAKISAEKISEMTKMSLRTIKSAVKQLKETGYITDVRVENGNIAFYTLKKIINISIQEQMHEEIKNEPLPDWYIKMTEGK